MAKWESKKSEPSFRGGVSGGCGVDSHYNKIYVKYLATKRPLNILNQNDLSMMYARSIFRRIFLGGQKTWIYVTFYVW